jgi:CheY-like chemotaxis protein
VRLPLAPAADEGAGAGAGGRAAPAGGARPAGASGAPGRRVLLIEDNDDARTAMLRLLRLWGHGVEVAATGAEGVRLAVASPPEVMLVDIGLPDVDGYEVARRVRAALGPGVCLVALTGYGLPEDRQRTAAAGFDHHVIKPIHPDLLQNLLRDGVR